MTLPRNGVGRPIRVVLQEFDIELVQPPGCLDVDKVVFELPDSRYAGKRQEEAKMISEITIVAGDRLTGTEIFSFQDDAIGRQNELGLGGCRPWTLAQRGKRFADPTCGANGDMDVVALENTARDIRCDGRAAAQALDRRLLVAERGKEGEQELIWGEGGASELRYSFLDFDCVHANKSLRSGAS